MGIAALGEYLLLRRVLAWLQPAEQLGMGNALPRFVAYGVGGPERELRGFLGVSLATSGGLAAVVCLVLYGGESIFGRWLFGSFQMEQLILPLGLLALGMTVHYSAYGYFRGRLDLIQANALQALNVVVIPLLAVVAFARARSIPFIVTTIALATLGLAAAVCAAIFRRGASMGCAGLWTTTRNLLGYGLPRVPGDFALGAFLALGPLVAMRFAPVSAVTALLLGISILSAVSASATPVGTLMLSKVSMMLVQDRRDEVRACLRYLLAGVVAVSVFVCLLLAVFTDTLLHLWVGQRFGGSIIEVRIIILAIPFYLIYGVLRGSVDAASITAYNTHNLLLSLGLFVILLFGVVEFMPARHVLEGVSAALLVACALLAVLTLRSTRKLLGLTMPWRMAAPGVIAGGVIAGVTALAQEALGSKLNTLECLLLAVAASLAFALMLAATRSEWLRFFLDVAFKRDRHAHHAIPDVPSRHTAAMAVAPSQD